MDAQHLPVFLEGFIAEARAHGITDPADVDRMVKASSLAGMIDNPNFAEGFESEWKKLAVNYGDVATGDHVPDMMSDLDFWSPAAGGGMAGFVGGGLMKSPKAKMWGAIIGSLLGALRGSSVHHSKPSFTMPAANKAKAQMAGYLVPDAQQTSNTVDALNKAHGSETGSYGSYGYPWSSPGLTSSVMR